MQNLQHDDKSWTGQCFFLFSPDIMALEPSFDVPIVNITVVAGKTAVLPCSIDSLGDFKVSQIYSYM